MEHGSTNDRPEADAGGGQGEHDSDHERPADVADDFVRSGAADRPTDAGATDDSGRTDDDSVTVRVGRLDDPGDEGGNGSARTQNGPVGFYVEDDGPGIPPEMRDVVFEIGHSTKPEGTGFGLWIIHEIADAHGWRLSITEGAAGGTRVEVRNVTIEPDSDFDSDSGFDSDADSN